MPPTNSSDGRRIFLAGASGIIGQRLIPLLVRAGHVVGGITRSPSKTDLLTHLGAEPILCDVFDREAFIQAVRDFKPEVVLNELTDLPDDAARISERADLNARIRTEGTRNVIEAARRSGSPKILAQSVAWQLPDGPDAQVVAELERSILAEGGVVLRYGRFYGPGTYNEQRLPEEPRVHIDRAAERTVAALESQRASLSLSIENATALDGENEGRAAALARQLERSAPLAERVTPVTSGPARMISGCPVAPRTWPQDLQVTLDFRSGLTIDRWGTLVLNEDDEKLRWLRFAGVATDNCMSLGPS